MKIVCICGEASADKCVASGLIPEHDVSLIIAPDYEVSRPAKLWKKSIKKKFFTKVVNSLFFRMFTRRPSPDLVGEEILRRGSGELDLASVSPKVERVPFFEINSKSVQDMILRHKPDLLFVCGAPILKPRIFSIPKYGAVNFHYGFSPKYKGQHGLLWAYNRRDHEGLGGTFLKIDEGVDTGTPISFVFPEIDKTDPIEVIEAKIALLARTHISEAMQTAARATETQLPITDEHELQEEFMVRFADYGPLEHALYHLQLMRNKFFLRQSTLREEQVKVVLTPQTKKFSPSSRRGSNLGQRSRQS